MPVFAAAHDNDVYLFMLRSAVGGVCRHDTAKMGFPTR